MPLHFCPVSCEDDAYAPPVETVSTLEQPPLQDAGDTGPRGRMRGNYRGFLPAHLLRDLRASADSGAGLAFVSPGVASGSSLVGPLLLVGLFALASRSRRS